MDYQLVPDGAATLLQAAGAGKNAFMTRNQNGNVFVLNTHTFSQIDFDAVGEVLLCPRQLGLLELPKPWINIMRSAFRSEEHPVIDAPSRVSMQQLSDRSIIIHNYNQESTAVNIQLSRAAGYMDGFTGKSIPAEGNEIKLEMAPRSRIWIKIKK